MGEADPLHHTTTYEYGEGGCGACGSEFGALAKKTDPMNQTSEYRYDSRGRLEKILYTGTADEVRFGYDAAGNRTAMGDTRLAATFGAGNLTFTWEYDTLGRVTKEIYPNGDYLTWSYNALGQRAAMRLPNGDIQTYDYDSPRGRLAEIVNPRSGKSGSFPGIG